MKKAVIFDLDGTLLDTLDDIRDSLNIMLERYGFSTATENEVRFYVGNGARNLVKRAIKQNVPETLLDECLDFYNHVYNNSGSPRTKLFDGVADALISLKSRGYKLAILTNKPQQSTDRIYEKYLKEFNFDEVVGQSPSVACKPDKTATLNILKRLGVETGKAYFVGDGETDVMTSINAGTRGIAALWGNRTEEQLAAVGATVFAKTPADLERLITL